MSGFSGITIFDKNGIRMYDLKDMVIIIENHDPEKKDEVKMKIDPEKISISAEPIKAAKIESPIYPPKSKKAAFFNLSNPLFYHELKERVFNIFRENNLSFYQAETALELLIEDLKDMKVV